MYDNQHANPAAMMDLHGVPKTGFQTYISALACSCMAFQCCLAWWGLKPDYE
jgi:hypothetical protein